MVHLLFTNLKLTQIHSCDTIITIITLGKENRASFAPFLEHQDMPPPHKITCCCLWEVCENFLVEKCACAGVVARLPFSPEEKPASEVPDGDALFSELDSDDDGHVTPDQITDVLEKHTALDTEAARSVAFQNVFAYLCVQKNCSSSGQHRAT